MPQRARDPERDAVAELADVIGRMSEAELQAWMSTLDDDDLDVVERVLSGLRAARWKPEPHQVPPDDVLYTLWLLMGGRGCGKTDSCAHEFDRHMRGPPCIPDFPGGHLGVIIAPTLGDASTSCVNGVSGLRMHNPDVREVTRKGGTIVEWPHGATAKLLGAYTPQDVERLRAAGNTCIAWCEELAAWRYLRSCWNHLEFGLRLGPHPHALASTTPKNRPHLRRLLKRSTTRISTATTDDNPHLPERRRRQLYEIFGGTRLGDQELLGMMLDKVEGALWDDELIEQSRLDKNVDAVPKMRRICVGVDPSWGTTGDECGIVACGRGWNSRGYVLDDKSVRGSPLVWGQAAVDLYWDLEADVMAVEKNFQGEQVRLVMMQTSHPKGKPNVQFVNASRGKQLRAEPVLHLYEQSKVSHVGRHALLEYQMTTWVPDEPRDEDDDEDIDAAPEPADLAEQRAEEGATDPEEMLLDFKSPDRVDALVFALTELFFENKSGPASLGEPTGRLPDARTVLQRSQRTGIRVPRTMGRRR